MKNFKLGHLRHLLLAPLMFWILSCQDQEPVGATDITVLPNAEFTITSKTIVSNSLVVKGIVKNGSNVNYTPEWYVEGEFFQDSTFALELGGATQELNYSMAPGVETEWQLSFTPGLLDSGSYTHFAVKNLRAYTQPAQ